MRRRRPGPLPPATGARVRPGPRSATTAGKPGSRPGSWPTCRPTPATWSPSGAPPRSCCARPPRPCEVYNDLDGEVVGFFRVLRERPGELVEAIRRHALRPRRDRRGVRAHPAGPRRPGAGPAGVRAGLAGAPRPARPGPDGLALRAGGDRLPDGGRAVGRPRPPAGRRRRGCGTCSWSATTPCGSSPASTGRTRLYYIDPPYPAATRGARWATARLRPRADGRRPPAPGRGPARAARDGRRQRLPLRPVPRAVRRLAGGHPPRPDQRRAGGHRGPVAVAARRSRLGARQLSLLEEERP